MQKYLSKVIQGAAMAAVCSLFSSSIRGDWAPALEYTDHWAAGVAVAQNDLCSGDINGDGETEIVALSTTTVDGEHHAQLRIARWNGSDYTVLAEQFWTSVAAADMLGRGVDCADLVPAGGLDVVTATQAGGDAELRVRYWNAAEGSLAGAGAPLTFSGAVRALAIADADGDGMPEILTGGSAPGGGAEIRIFNFMDDRLVQQHAESWSDGQIFGLAVADVDADGDSEIVTAATLFGAAEAIELRILQWNGSAVAVEADTVWEAGDDTSAADLALGNIDSDALAEIAVVGTLTDTDASHPLFGVVSVWEWDGSTLDIQDHRVWQSELGNVEYFGTAMADLDGDGVDEISVAGPLHEEPPQNILRVYGWARGRIFNQYSEHWIAPGMRGNFAYVVHAADVDDDARVEVVTGGRALSPEGSAHQITIWQLEWSSPSLLWGWLNRLKQVFAWEGWPFYEAFGDTLPWPWSAVLYAGSVFAIVASVGFGLWRARIQFRRQRRRSTH